ncbi:MAG: flagellar assembly protein FliX, partial [Alphaproteobacteria bacterium]
SLSGKSPEQQAKEQADTLLLQLETLRLGLLSGSLPVKVLHNLAASLKKQRPQVSDPQLLEILDEIDLRAQVELAKYEQK